MQTRNMVCNSYRGTVSNPSQSACCVVISKLCYILARALSPDSTRCQIIRSFDIDDILETTKAFLVNQQEV